MKVLDRKKYGFYLNELKKKTKDDVYYVQCDCGHLAIRQNNQTGLFKCSICCERYIINQFREVVIYDA